MNDASAMREEPPQGSSGLIYPLRSPPPPGDTLEVAPGIHWLRMQLPIALDHINLWALEDGDGWTVIDTGMQTADIAAAWR
jgi:glyoxylase-like metal-dependent hydrolase (beta-lactamase superfamily II)